MAFVAVFISLFLAILIVFFAFFPIRLEKQSRPPPTQEFFPPPTKLKKPAFDFEVEGEIYDDPEL